tara:strand:+ start:340 stop:540 length:201 start_codon:yes stop_codon:yes gene_type:complete
MEWPILDDGSIPQQLRPHGGIVPIRRSVDTHLSKSDHQLYQPLIMPNQVDGDDYKNFYNAHPEPTY